MVKRRIKDTPISSNDFRAEFYNIYRKPIEFYLGTPKEESVYVEDEELKNELLSIILNNESKIVYFLGKGGIGKTTFLKNTFGLLDNTVVFDEENKTAYISMIFRGQLLENDIKYFFINSVSSLCTALEERYNFRKQFYTIEGHNEFYEYVKDTKRALLEYVTSIEMIGKSEQEVKLLRLQRGEERDPYTYIASKLKFYLSRYCKLINNITLLVDNIEALPPNIQFMVARNALAFFSCMLNTPKKTGTQSINSNLLLSMRQTTYENLNESEVINAYSPSVILYKENPIDMCKYFQLKKETLTESNKEEQTWEEAYEIIMNLSNKFNGKYSKMIRNLSNYDFQLMKKCYKRILTNKVWLLRGERRRDFLNMSKTDRLFNNISVVRSIACGNNVVYRDMKSIVIPNVLMNSEFHNDSMIGLLVLAFFIKKGSIVNKSDLHEAFGHVFGNNAIVNEALIRVTEKFIANDILEETFRENAALKNNKYLFITPRGIEIWGMFVADSVILEMYREDFYFNEQERYCNFSSSYSLMETVGQYEIFMQLFHYINILLNEERLLHEIASNNSTLSEYYSCFGKKIQVKRLLEGVIKSIEYSGNMYSFDIQDAINKLETDIKNIDQGLEDR